MLVSRTAILAIVASLGSAVAGCGAPLPPPIAAEAARTEPGKATVVEFIDFQCEFCRRTHQALAPLVNVRRDKIRLVRKHVPLSRHQNALPAALAALCAEAQGKGDEMADLLVSAPVSRLRSEGCEDIAVEIGLDIDRFRTCVTDPNTAERVRADDALFDAVGGGGVPLLFIGATRLTGLQNEEVLERALDEAISKASR
jgi:protein-disulfide isomerase